MDLNLGLFWCPIPRKAPGGVKWARRTLQIEVTVSMERNGYFGVVLVKKLMYLWDMYFVKLQLPYGIR